MSSSREELSDAMKRDADDGLNWNPNDKSQFETFVPAAYGYEAVYARAAAKYTKENIKKVESGYNQKKIVGNYEIYENDKGTRALVITGADGKPSEIRIKKKDGDRYSEVILNGATLENIGGVSLTGKTAAGEVNCQQMVLNRIEGQIMKGSSLDEIYNNFSMYHRSPKSKEALAQEAAITKGAQPYIEAQKNLPACYNQNKDINSDYTFEYAGFDRNTLEPAMVGFSWYVQDSYTNVANGHSYDAGGVMGGVHLDEKGELKAITLCGDEFSETKDWYEKGKGIRPLVVSISKETLMKNYGMTEEQATKQMSDIVAQIKQGTNLKKLLVQWNKCMTDESKEAAAERMAAQAYKKRKELNLGQLRTLSNSAGY